MFSNLVICCIFFSVFALLTGSNNQIRNYECWIFENLLIRLMLPKKTNNKLGKTNETCKTCSKLVKNIRIYNFGIGGWIQWARYYLLWFLPMFPGSSSSFAIWCIFLCLALIRPKNFRITNVNNFIIKKKKILEMVFCYQNCSDLLWEKNVLVIEKNFWNSRLKAENLQNIWDH